MELPCVSSGATQGLVSGPETMLCMMRWDWEFRSISLRSLPELLTLHSALSALVFPSWNAEACYGLEYYFGLQLPRSFKVGKHPLLQHLNCLRLLLLLWLPEESPFLLLRQREPSVQSECRPMGAGGLVLHALLPFPQLMCCSPIMVSVAAPCIVFSGERIHGDTLCKPHSSLH